MNRALKQKLVVKLKCLLKEINHIHKSEKEFIMVI